MKKYLLGLMLIASAYAQVPVVPVFQPHVTFVDASGSPCSGCKLYSDVAGTTTPLATYADGTGTSTNTNPIILDTAGGANIWFGRNSYKLILKDASGTTLWTVDGINATETFDPDQITGVAVVKNPPSNATQTINGSINLNTFDLISVQSVNSAVIYALGGQALSAAIAKAGSNPAMIFITAQTLVPTSLTVPANIQLVFAGGYLNITGGQTLTLTSTPVAPENQQIFQGTGLVVGLTTVRPEWFGGATPNATAMRTALAACSGGTCQYLLRAVIYPNAWPEATPMTQDYVRFIGSGEGDYNSANTAVVGGTILQGPLAVLANYFELHDACVDSGSALYPSTGQNGIAMYNPTSTPGLPQWQSPLLENVCVLGQTALSAFHAVALENTNNAKVINLRTRFDEYGLVLKSTNAVVDGLVGSGHGLATLYVKSDDYAPGGDDSISNVHASAVASGDTVGFAIEGATANLSRVTINGFTGHNLSIGGIINSAGSFSTNDVTIQGLALETMTQDGVKASGTVNRLKIENAVINNTGGGGVTLQGGNVNYSTISNVQVTTTVQDGFFSTGQYNKFSNDYSRSAGGYGFHLASTSSSAWLDGFTSLSDTSGAVHVDAGSTIFPSIFPGGLSVGGGPTITSTGSFTQYVGAIAPTTTATTYTVTVPSLPAGSHCFVSPQNIAAAGMLATTYVPLNVSAGSTVVNTNGTAGGNFTVYCSFQ